jgi:uncharacterized membrane protein
MNTLFLAAGLLLFARLSLAADVQYRFTLLDIPIEFQGRQDTLRLIDRNNKDEMIGVHYFGASYYLKNAKSKPVQLNCGLETTVASAINNSGQITGSCDGPGFNGFIYNPRTKAYTLLNYPNADGTIAYSINDLGHVVGQYWGFAFGTGSNRFHGFVWKDGEYTTLDAPDPDQLATALVGINKQGQIIGTYLHHIGPGINDYDKEIAFLADNGSFESLGIETYPHDINNDSQVIGLTYDSTGKQIFFLFDDDRFFKVTGFPHSDVVSATQWGLNDQAEIAGSYYERVPCEECSIHGEPASKLILHSFMASPAPLRRR